MCSELDCLCRLTVMGRSRESVFEFSSGRAPRVKKRRAPYRRNSIDAKLERHNERRMKLARVSEEEEPERHVKRGCWSIRVRQGKLVTPVVRYLKRFRRSCTSIASLAAAPFRCYKLDVLLAKLHLSRRRSSRRIHSLLTTSSPSDEHAPLLPRLRDPLEV